jgi:hypothetical protein
MGVGELAGFWQPVHNLDTLLTSQGTVPPLTAAGKTVYEAHLAAA